ncbi:MAG: AAA family ATPase [Sulfurimonas sp.]|uniref:Lon protease family protein n=1 Tax=Sulfurimonas sp. TaxID=2022749 RepID=UPI0026167DB4|nr:ATP-binding protein [Sulfurimonas sp.]MCW8894410.1 AAA family ATPase [Sulfurimonas sp.]MCW8953485.1 AAA family ATPase [Sulfurimonas sp.]MCW9068347.1 AAA family ATPase [Sulfurimonas sp.]
MLKSLESSQLYNTCDTSLFSFKTTKELEPLEQFIGQENALKAVDFGTNIQQDGYNLFAMGPSGSGKHSTVMTFLQAKAKSEAAPSDWCYVNNFKDNQKPVAIELPAGQAYSFKDDIDELIDMLKSILPTVFESDNYRNERELIDQKYIDLQTSIFTYLQEEAKNYDVAMNSSSPSRVTFVPIVDGKKLSAQEFQAIEGEQKENIKKKMTDFEAIVKEQLHKVGELNKAILKEFKELDKKTTQEAVESLIDEVRLKYKNYEKIVSYIDALQEDVIHNVQDFLAKTDDISVPPFMREFYTPSFARYRVNLFISQNNNKSAPVIYEDNPIHQNLIGKVEHISQVGTLVTDFSMIKPGALHKASGGYLVLDARKLLMKPFAYEGLKRVLRAKEIRIESMAQEYSLISTTSLEPEPIPVNTKVVLIGERIIYYLLYHYDPDFKELFKVNADFEDEMPRNDKNLDLYARMIGTIAKNNELLPLNAEAVARVIEQSSRDVSHSLKFSTHIGTIADLLKEADYYSKKSKHKSIKKDDIEKALSSQIERKNRIQLKLYEQIDEGTIMINVSGEKVGQINALSYISIGGHQFGIPSRITARSRIGKGEIIDIQRKVELGGPIHSKGVMILSAYLGSKYAKELPLSLSVSLAFEQSYGMIEGDSASSTELYAIISSICEVPIKQNIAVTGSVNQFGEIQPIGGVNEKIEGFFDICMKKNSKAFYGVIIPHTNVKHLMLKPEIVEAVKEGSFAIYAVKSIDEGISILTGIEAGKADKKGKFPKKSINGMVVAHLEKFSKTLREFSHPKDNKKIHQ